MIPLSQRKLPALDGVRGLAILAVMFAHVYSQRLPLPHVVRDVFHVGWCGVDLFFALSGFLITGILLDTRLCANYFRSFYARRFLRIFPLYYSFLLVALLVLPHLVPAQAMPAKSDRWLYVCYLANWQQLLHWPNHVLEHFWSLSVEEQFYFVWPMVVFLLGPRRLLPVALGLELALLGVRSYWPWAVGTDLATSAISGFVRIDSLLLGAAAAVIVRQFQISRSIIRSLPGIAALFFSTFLAGLTLLGYRQREVFTQSVGYAMLAVSFAALVLYAAISDGQPSWQQAAMRWKPLVLFGKYSYGIYVFHVPVFYLMDQSARHLPPVLRHSLAFSYSFIALKFAVAFVIAALSYNFFEKRFLALKDRFAPVYRETPAAAIAVAQVG